MYRIKNRGTGKYIDVEGPNKTSGTKIQQWDYSSSLQQIYKLSVLANGDYVIESMFGRTENGGMYLKVENGSSQSGANIVLYSDYSWTSSRWKIANTDD